MSQLSYVLITPAKNEEAYIGVALESVANQTRVPLKWVVIDDGSTDRTAEIVRSYAAKHPWIELITRRQKSTRSFASKADAFNEACATVKDLDFDVIGNLDADVSFAPDYMERILQKLADDPKLGMAGTSSRTRLSSTTIDSRASSMSLARSSCLRADASTTSAGINP